MDVAVRKLLLVCANFVQFWSHLSISMSSTHLATENMTSLCCSSLLLVSVRATNGVRSSVLTASRIDFRNNMHLVLIIHNKFLSISSVNCAHSTSRSSRNDLALRCNGWDFVIVLLLLIKIKMKIVIILTFGMFGIFYYTDLSIDIL